MKTWKKIGLCVLGLIILAALIFAGWFIIRWDRARRHSNYCMNSIKQEFGSSIENFNLSAPVHFEDMYLYTGRCIYEGINYGFGCTVHNKNNVVIPYLKPIEETEENEQYESPVIDKSSQEYLEHKEYYDFVEMLRKEPIEYHFENTDKEAKSYGWKYLKKSKCYDASFGYIDRNENPEKDSNGRNINCYDKDGLKQGVRYETSLFSDLMDINNYVDGKRNGKHFTLYSNSKLASEGTYVDGEIEGLRTTYTEDGRIKRVIEYVNGEMVEN